jgi:hypothetical protein
MLESSEPNKFLTPTQQQQAQPGAEEPALAFQRRSPPTTPTFPLTKRSSITQGLGPATSQKRATSQRARAAAGAPMASFSSLSASSSTSTPSFNLPAKTSAGTGSLSFHR